MSATRHGCIPVQFWVHKHLSYPWTQQDYYVAIVGQGRQFGSENPYLAKRLKCCGNDQWMKEFWLPQNSMVKYKFLIARACNGTPVQIECLSPRVVHVGQDSITLEHIFNRNHVMKTKRSGFGTRYRPVQTNKEYSTTVEKTHSESAKEQNLLPSLVSSMNGEMQLPEKVKTEANDTAHVEPCLNGKPKLFLKEKTEKRTISRVEIQSLSEMEGQTDLSSHKAKFEEANYLVDNGLPTLESLVNKGHQSVNEALLSQNLNVDKGFHLVGEELSSQNSNVQDGIHLANKALSRQNSNEDKGFLLVVEGLSSQKSSEEEQVGEISSCHNSSKDNGIHLVGEELFSQKSSEDKGIHLVGEALFSQKSSEDNGIHLVGEALFSQKSSEDKGIHLVSEALSNQNSSVEDGIQLVCEAPSSQKSTSSADEGFLLVEKPLSSQKSSVDNGIKLVGEALSNQNSSEYKGFLLVSGGLSSKKLKVEKGIPVIGDNISSQKSSKDEGIQLVDKALSSRQNSKMVGGDNEEKGSNSCWFSISRKGLSVLASSVALATCLGLYVLGRK